MAYDDRTLTGIGGWLALLIILLVLSAIGNVVVAVSTLPRLPDLTAQFGTAWTAFLAVSWLSVAVKAGGFAYLAWRLNARQVAATPRTVIIGLWAILLYTLLVEPLAGFLLIGAGPSAVTLELVGRNVLFTILSTWYLSASQRVAATYTDEPD